MKLSYVIFIPSYCLIAYFEEKYTLIDLFFLGGDKPLPLYIYIHRYIHRYIHTYIHTYIDTYIHTSIHSIKFNKIQ